MPTGVYKRKPLSEETKRKISASLMGKKRPKEVVEKVRRSQKGKSKPKCEKDCLCGKHTVSEETKRKLSELRSGKRWGRETSGRYLSEDGYWVLTGMQGHPLVLGRSVREGVRRGEVLEHRMVLWAALGCKSVECVHDCHWCKAELSWSGQNKICADHINGDRGNNCPENLVASCLPCNVRRGMAGNPSDWSG